MKRILCLLLIVVVAFSSVLTSAAAFATESGMDSLDMEFIRALEIVTEDTEATAGVTRYDLAQMYYRILLNNVEIGGESDSKDYTDLDDFQAECVAAVSGMKIMVGTDDGTFSPDDNVTYAQLLKTIVVFLGYGDLAEEAGGYPLGYFRQAKRLDIVNESAAELDREITFAKAASIFKLAANVNLRTPIQGNYLDAGIDYLEAYFGIKHQRMFISGDNITDLYGDATLVYDEVRLDSNPYRVTERTLSIKNYVGFWADVCYKEQPSPTVVYYELCDNQTREISVEDIIAVSSSGSEITMKYYDENGNAKKLRLDRGIYVVYNGSLCENYQISVFNPLEKDKRLQGKLRLIDNNDDGNYEVVFIETYRSYVVNKVYNNKIYNKFIPNEIFELESFEEGNVQILNIEGDPIPFSDISEGDILSVFSDRDGKINRIVVSIDTYTGVIDSITDTKRETVIGGNLFSYTEALRQREDFDTFIPGAAVKVYFNMNGEISDFERSTSSDIKLGYLIDGAETGGFTSIYTFKIFTESGSIDTYDLAEKVKLNQGENTVEAKEAYLAAGNEGSRLRRQVIRYKLNQETGEISELQYCSGTESCDGLYMYEGFDGATTRADLPYKTSGQTFGGKLLVNEGTIVFSVPNEQQRNDEKWYQIKKISSVFSNDDNSRLFEAYGTEKDSPLAAAVVIKTSSSTSASLDDNMILIDTVGKTMDDEGNHVDVVYGVCNGVEEEILFENGALNGFDSGDVIFPVSKQSNGVWERAELVFDYSAGALKGENPSDKFSANIRFCYGELIRKEDGCITVRIADLGGNTSLEYYNLARFKLAEYDEGAARSEKKGRAGNEDRMLAAKDYPDNPSYVLIHLRRGDAKSIIVYNQ